MTCGGIDPHNIYLWSSLAGILTGGGFSFIISPSRRRHLPASLFFFSAAVLCALCGVILGDAARTASLPVLIWFGAAAATGFAAVLFPRLLGIPLFFLIIILTISVYYSLYYWSCVLPGTEIGRVSMLSQGEDFIRIQYEDSSGNRSIEVLPGRFAVPIIEKIEFPDYFFIIRERRLFRFHGFTGNEDAPEPGFIPGFILNFVMKLPGFTYGQAEAAGFRPYPSLYYSLSLDDEGLPVIKRVVE